MDLKLHSAVMGDAALLGLLNRFVHDAHVQVRPDQFRATEPDELAAWFRGLLEKPSVCIWIAEVDGSPAGYISTVEFERPRNALCEARRWIEIDNVAVDPMYRRRGVGRALVDVAVSAALADGVAEVELTSWAFNEGAHLFFERLGFRAKKIGYALRDKVGNHDVDSAVRSTVLTDTARFG